MLLTLLRGQVLKGLVNFVAPSVALCGLARVWTERAWQFVVGGILALGLSAVLWYIVITH
jgi:hypothetical protein